MIKDITLGQYFPGNSMVHRLDPRYKIIISGIFIAMLFIGDHVICLEIGAVFVAMALILSSIPLKMIVKSIKPIIPLLLFTSLFNIFFISFLSNPLEKIMSDSLIKNLGELCRFAFLDVILFKTFLSSER